MGFSSLLSVLEFFSLVRIFPDAPIYPRTIGYLIVSSTAYLGTDRCYLWALPLFCYYSLVCILFSASSLLAVMLTDFDPLGF